MAEFLELNKYQGWVSLILLCGAAVFIGLYSPNPPSKTTDSTEAWSYTQLAVEHYLKNPARAEWPQVKSSQVVTPLGDNMYKVSSYVDTENELGDRVRKHFAGTIKKTSNGWKVETLDFDL